MSKASNIEFREKKKAKGKSVDVIFKEELTIYSIEKIKEDFSKAFTKYNNIKITLKDVTNIDLSFLQFMYSIQKSAKKNNKTLSFDIKISEEIQLLINNSGLEKILKYNSI